jgi:agmatine deiminase
VTPADDGFFMPAEWEPHSRCWMAWPCRLELWGERYEQACMAYAAIARHRRVRAGDDAGA